MGWPRLCLSACEHSPFSYIFFSPGYRPSYLYSDLKPSWLPILHSFKPKERNRIVLETQKTHSYRFSALRCGGWMASKGHLCPTIKLIARFRDRNKNYCLNCM